MFIHVTGRFQKNLRDPRITAMQGTVVVFTNGRFYYHNGSTWVPREGLTPNEWIKLFHHRAPHMEEDHFAIIMGLSDNDGALDDDFDLIKVRNALNTFLDCFPEEYAIWPDGDQMEPLSKSRKLTKKHKVRKVKVAKALDTTITPAPDDGESHARRRHDPDMPAGHIAKTRRIILTS